MVVHTCNKVFHWPKWRIYSAYQTVYVVDSDPDDGSLSVTPRVKGRHQE